MTCRHCGYPAGRCPYDAIHSRTYCRGWRHTDTGWHTCQPPFRRELAEPQPGQLPAGQAPASEPTGEVA